MSKGKEWGTAVNIRAVTNTTVISEISVQVFGNGGFQIIHSDGKGMSGVQDMIVIDNYSEACGIDGGNSYVLYTDKQLIHMANTSEVGDGGIYHNVSSFTFPSDPNGVKD